MTTWASSGTRTIVKHLRTTLGLICCFAATGVALRSAEAASFMVQIASMKSLQAANNEWARLQSTYRDLLGDLHLTIETVELGARGTYYRIQTGPFPNRATAQDMCWQIRARKLDCLVVRRR